MRTGVFSLPRGAKRVVCPIRSYGNKLCHIRHIVKPAGELTGNCVVRRVTAATTALTIWRTQPLHGFSSRGQRLRPRELDSIAAFGAYCRVHKNRGVVAANVMRHAPRPGGRAEEQKLLEGM